MLLLQVNEVIEQAEKVLNKGQGADVTVIGVMGVFCIVMGTIAVVLWRSNTQKDADIKHIQIDSLKALLSAQSVMQEINKTSENNGVKIEVTKDKIIEANNKLGIIINELQK